MTPRVQDIIKAYQKGNIQAVEEYLFQEGMFIEEASWAGAIKKLLEQKMYNTAACDIEIVAYKFKNLIK